MTTDDLGKQIFVYGEADYSKLESALKLLGWNSVNTLVDVGANIGHIAILAIKRGVAQSGVALEPDPVNFGCLALNSRLNGVEARLEMIHAAAGSGENASLLLAVHPEEFGDHRIVRAGEPSGDRRLIQVPAVQLDDACGDLTPTRDLVWMDIQGYEVVALRGAQRLISLKVPLVIEFWPEGIQSTGESYESLLGLLQETYDEYANLSKADPHFLPLTDLSDLWEELTSPNCERTYVDILLR